MRSKSRTFLLAAILTVAGLNAVQAQDFFSSFFGGPPRGYRERAYNERSYNPFGGDFFGAPRGYEERRSQPRASRQAFCVRTCDGRHFPLTASGEQSRETTCNNFCPASETKVYYGSAIETSYSETGKAYGDLKNAFRYRTELVSGCTCNGKDALGLAAVKIEDDPTLRRGDIVAGEDGLLVSRRDDRRGAIDLQPVPTRAATR